MDTTKLKVDQKIYMFSGPYVCEGTVVKVSTEGVEVRRDRQASQHLTFKGGEVYLHFDSNGKGCEVHYDSGEVWNIDDIPYEERNALNEKLRQEWCDKHRQEWCDKPPIRTSSFSERAIYWFLAWVLFLILIWTHGS